jgi:ferredoxin-nitrite reductase
MNEDMKQSVAPGGFERHQEEYLKGFVAGLRAAPYVGLASDGRLTADAAAGGVNLAAEAAEETVFGTPVSELSKEELIKREVNPLDIWERIVQHADEDRAPDPADTFRFKFHGLFYVAPAQDSFMLRIRVPGCALRSEQLRGLADMAERWGNGRADITTRGNLQLREFRPRDVANVLMSLQELGLSSRGSGADNIRNITATPTSGVDRDELIDVLPLAKALQFYITNHRDLYGLPRKFNIAFDSGGAVSVVADTNDIAFEAVRARADAPGGARVGFRVGLAGITGHRQFALPTDLFVTPEQCVAVAAAMVRVFNENGDRTNRKKARLKYLIDRWGVEKFLEETQRRLAFPLERLPREALEARRPVLPHGHIGVYRAKQAGMNYVGVVVPVGRLPVDQMRALARLAEAHGSGEVRLTVWQNAIIPHVPDGQVEALRRGLSAAGLDCETSAVQGGLVACTGRRGCKYAATDTKAHAVALGRHLRDRVALDHPVNIHFTGCPHSCAQHYIGDIGLVGAKVGDDEGYHVCVGGGSDQAQAVGRELFRSVRAAEVPVLVERMLKEYLARRVGNETFHEFAQRHEAGALQEMCS